MKPTLVFVHGSGCTGEVFGAQVAAFPNSIALTLPGHRTPGSLESIGRMSDWVAQELETRSVSDVVVVGNSMGGAIALELAARANPRVRAVVAIGSGAKLRVSSAIFEAIERDFEAAAQTIAGYLFSKDRSDLAHQAAQMMLRVGRKQTELDFRACDAFDVTERLEDIRVPLLALAGENDVMTPPKFALFLGDRVPGASARILPGAGHMAMVECPVDTNEALRAFVTEIV